MQAWEDLRPKTAVAANVGAGPDIVLAWLDDPHLYQDKILDLSELADYIGNRYGGWFPAAERYGKTDDGRWIGMPIGAGGGCNIYRKCSTKPASRRNADRLPGAAQDLPGAQGERASAGFRAR